MNFNESLLDGAAHNRMAQRALKKFGNNGQNIYSHVNLIQKCVCSAKIVY